MSGKQKYTPRKIGTIVDTIHIVIGIAVTLMSAFAVVRPERFMFLFPLIFALAGVLSFVTGWYGIITYQKIPRRRIAIAMYFVIGVLLLMLFVVSAISIWLN